MIHCINSRIFYFIWLCFLYSIKVIDCNGRGLLSNVERGIYHVIQRANITRRRSVISLGFTISAQGLEEAVRDAISNNIVVVTSAGND